jgi:hypothetical protein
LQLFKSGRIALSRVAINSWISFLPAAFKKQNISLADVGEKHHWVWDFYQLSEALSKSGFSDIIRQSPTSSNVHGFPFYPLDVRSDGSPRKGFGSMYVEAKK